MFNYLKNSKSEIWTTTIKFIDNEYCTLDGIVTNFVGPHPTQRGRQAIQTLPKLLKILFYFYVIFDGIFRCCTNYISHTVTNITNDRLRSIDLIGANDA